MIKWEQKPVASGEAYRYEGKLSFRPDYHVVGVIWCDSRGYLQGTCHVEEDLKPLYQSIQSIGGFCSIDDAQRGIEGLMAHYAPGWRQAS